MKNIITSKNFSLACAVINGVWSVQMLSNGNWAFGLIAAGFCAFCANNYVKAGK